MNRYKRSQKELEIITMDCKTIQSEMSDESKNLGVIKAYTPDVNYEGSKPAKKCVPCWKECQYGGGCYACARGGSEGEEDSEGEEEMLGGRIDEETAHMK
jgi:hypothetical protein